MASEQFSISALHAYDILDTPAAPEFDDIVRLACQSCRAPIGIVGFVTPKRQWFKARNGIAGSEIPINHSVCTVALGSGRDLFEVLDLAEHPLTRNIPLVTGPLRVRYYAGAVLRSPRGEPLGTVCIYDTVPRREGLNVDEAAALQGLARLTMILLELHRAVGLGGGDANLSVLH